MQSQARGANPERPPGRWQQAWEAVAGESPAALEQLVRWADDASLPRADAAACAGAVLLVEHLQAERYRHAAHMLSVLAAIDPKEVAATSEGLLAMAGAAVAHDYGMLPSWPAADPALLRERAQRAPADIALALGCALGEVCERNGQDAEFAALQAQLAAVAARPEASPFWCGHWAIVCAWHLGSFGHWQAALRELQRAEQLALVHGLHQLATTAALQRARLVESHRDPATALALAEQAVAGTDAERAPLRLADHADVLCRVALHRQDFHAAVAHARRATGFTQAADAWPGYRTTYAVNEAYALMGTGAFDDAHACLAAMQETLATRYLAERCAVLRDLAALCAADHRDSWDADRQASLAPVLRRLRALEWHSVLPSLPELVARLFARALDAGIETEWVRAAIRFRDLKAPPGATRHWPWPVRVQVLGDFRVEGDAAPLQPHAATSGRAASKPLDLLRLLAAHGHGAVPVDDLALALWPGDGREGRQKAFDITVARLRRLLKREDAVLVHDRRARLNGQCVWIDLAALHDALDRAEAAAEGEAARRAALDAALTLYRGPCLADSREPWADGARARVRARLAAALLLALNRDGGDRHHARVMALKCGAVDPALWPLLRSGPD